MLRLLQKVHQPRSTPWETRFSTLYGWSDSRDLGELRALDFTVWKDIAFNLAFYCTITSVKTGNGMCTPFWLEIWLCGCTLASRFTALLSQAMRLNASMARVWGSPELTLDFYPRLSSVAETELGSMLLLANVNLNSQVRDVFMIRLFNKLSSMGLGYDATFSSRAVDQLPPATRRTSPPTNAGCSSSLPWRRGCTRTISGFEG